MRSLFVLLVVSFILVLVPGHSQRAKVDPPQGPDWQRHAETYLVNFRENRPFSASQDRASRCIIANNYGCLWQSQANWEGTPGARGRDGAHDGAGLPRTNNGHAIFSHPRWSIIASMRWFERRTDGGRLRMSALRLAEIYSPWCDTIGSNGTRGDTSGGLWGRSCSGGKQPPAGFRGPTCRAPAAGQRPSAAQCQACNCPSSASEFWLRGTGLATDAPLELFGSERLPTATLLALIKNKIGLETGRFMPNDRLMTEALASFRPQTR